MNVKIIRGAEVNRPVPTPLNSTVLDHASVTELDSFGIHNNDGLFPSYNVLDTAVPTELCPDPTSTKQFSFAEWIEGHEFAVYGGVQCKSVGLDRDDMLSELRRVFEANEGRGVEQGLAEVFATEASDLTPPTAVSLLQGLAVLVGYAAQHYAGQPTIHMPRAAAVILFAAGALVERDGLFYTKTGAKVAAGGGYDTGWNGGVWDMYATGEVYVERSSLIEANAYVMPGDGSGTGSDENGLSPNTVLALAERMYRVAVDGFVAHVAATIITTGGGGMGVGVQNAVDNGDGTFSLVLTDGTETDPIALIAGPPGEDGEDGAPGVVQSIVQGAGIVVDATDPANPVVGVE